MTTTTSTSAEQTAHRPEDFTTSEGLRALLNRLYVGGEDAWVHDPVARELGLPPVWLTLGVCSSQAASAAL